MHPVLAIEHLDVRFATPAGEVAAVRDASLEVEAGECLGIVGESGSGKSQLFLAALGLLAPNGRARGSVRLAGRELLGQSEAVLQRVRGSQAAMIFQDPMSSLTPHMRIGEQLAEVLTTHRHLSHARALEKSAEALALVHIPDPPRRLRQYPHELSGGMRQRVMIAMAVLGEPQVLIADEPTTALDVTVQAQILDLLRELRHRLGTALVLIAHDLGVVAGLANRVVVMYAGRVVETGPVERILTQPFHPYTQGLLASIPDIRAAPGELPHGMAGQAPDGRRELAGCAFHPRCPRRQERCERELPVLQPANRNARVACHFPGPAP
jgi:oligopeptide transport system ATP-binding protein